MRRKLISISPLPQSVWFLCALASMAAAVGIAVISTRGSVPTIAGAATIFLPVIGLFSVLGLQSTGPGKRGRNSHMESRKSVIAWLDLRLAQPSESSRLAVLAVSVDAAETFGTALSGTDFTAALDTIEKKLASLLREDDMIARGDVTDFLICLSRVRAPQADTLDRVVRRLQNDIQGSAQVKNGRFHPVLTTGMASSRILKEATGQELLDAAEEAHEQALLLGQGSRTLYGAPPARPSADSALVSEVVDALENGQITAWYQPQLSTETGQITGFEALARWEHPTRGVVSPASFLPLIEQANMTRRLAKVIVTHALSALRAWDRAGLDAPSVGVNFSEAELKDPSLIDFLRWELDRFDLTPDRLAIEVLESVIADSYDSAVARNLRELSALGCRIDLDDFGTGSTSIMNIRSFDVSRIKIDRQLVTGAADSTRQRELVAAILAMSEHLRVETLGEGVETPEEHLALAQLGCGYVQGFAIARPMPLGDTLAWASEHVAEIEQARSIEFGEGSVRH